jgi:hypothetical protein
MLKDILIEQGIEQSDFVNAFVEFLEDNNEFILEGTTFDEIAIRFDKQGFWSGVKYHVYFVKQEEGFYDFELVNRW